MSLEGGRDEGERGGRGGGRKGESCPIINQDEHSAPLCHSRFYNSLKYVLVKRDGYFVVRDDYSYFSPFVPG